MTRSLSAGACSGDLALAETARWAARSPPHPPEPHCQPPAASAGSRGPLPRERR